MHTRCTHCEAVFRVTLLQLQSSSGRVQCGVCHQVFDAFVNLRAADPPPVAVAPEPEAPVVAETAPSSPPTVALVTAPEAPTAVAGVEVDIDTVAISEVPRPSDSIPDDGTASEDSGPLAEASAADVPETRDESDSDTASDALFTIEPAADDARAAAEDAFTLEGWPDEESDVGADAADSRTYSGTDEQTDDGSDELIISAEPAAASAISPPTVRPKRWPVALATSAALVALAGQAVYQFRTPIATALPTVRPALESACALVGCRVPLPRLPERLVIEASDLRALDPARPNRVVLATTVRNAAPVAQAYPMLELSLTDARDQVTARKVFGPQEYLDTPPRPDTGIGPDAEFSVRMQLDIGDIEASGYRLYLFHR